jgi:hypothetical protein
MRIAGGLCVLALLAPSTSCDVDECGDYETLDISSPGVCFSVTSTCAAPTQVVAQAKCSNGLLSDYEIHSSQAASCILTVTCADGTMTTLDLQWVSNGQCTPVTVIGGFDGIVCDDGGIMLPPPDATDATDAASE